MNLETSRKRDSPSDYTIHPNHWPLIHDFSKGDFPSDYNIHPTSDHSLTASVRGTLPDYNIYPNP